MLYSMPVSDLLTFLIGAVLIVLTYRELDGKRAGKRALEEQI